MDPFFFLGHLGPALLGSFLLSPSVLVSGFVEFAGLTVRPAELCLQQVDSTAPLTVYCNVTAFSDHRSALMNFQLARRLRGRQDLQVLATASAAKPDGHLQLTIAPVARQRPDVRLELEEGPPSVVLRLAEAACGDAAHYVCALTIRNLRSGITRTQTFEEEVLPSTRPYWRTSITGTTGGGRMKLICTAFVFTSINNFRWVWQKQKAEGSVWEPLTPEETVINVTPDPKDYCSSPALSTMTRALSEAVANKYRCYVQDLVSTMAYPQYAAVFTVGNLNEEADEMYYMAGGVMVGVFLFTSVIVIGYRFILYPLSQKESDMQKASVMNLPQAAPVASAVDGRKPSAPVPPAVIKSKPLASVPPAVVGTKPLAPEHGTSTTARAPEAKPTAPVVAAEEERLEISIGRIKPGNPAPPATSPEPSAAPASAPEDGKVVPASPASGAQPFTLAAEQKRSAADTADRV